MPLAIGNGIGIPFGGASPFDPSSITVGSVKTLQQQLLTKQRPLINGVVLDESSNKGTARPVQLGRDYLFDGVNDHVTLPIGIDLTLTGNTLRVRGYINFASQRIFLSKGGQFGGWMIGISGTNRLSVTLKQPASITNFRSFDSNTVLLVNTTYYVDVTFTTTSCTGTINGVTETFTDSGAVGSYGDSALIPSIGAREAGTSIFWQGEIYGLEIFQNGVLRGFYKMDEQENTISYDSSGNNFHGTLVNGVTHSTQNLISYQNDIGYSRYMQFDGVNDYVTVAGMVDTTNYFSSCTITANIFVETITGLNQVIWSLGASCYRLIINTAGIWNVNASSTGVVAVAGPQKVSVTYDSSGNATSLLINDVVVWTGLVVPGGNGTTTFSIGARQSGTFGLFFSGYIYDFSITNSSVKNFSFNGDTNINWIDTTLAGNNGVVSGSAVTVLIPMLTSTLTIFDKEPNLLAGSWHNGCETLLDIRGGVNSPISVINNWNTAWAFNTARVNPNFDRTLIRQGLDLRVDRFLSYRQALTGTNLTKINAYVATKSI
jgi:hypothetical protein